MINLIQIGGYLECISVELDTRIYKVYCKKDVYHDKYDKFDSRDVMFPCVIAYTGIVRILNKTNEGIIRYTIQKDLVQAVP